MKKLSTTIGKIFFYIFILAVMGWTASLTIAEMKAILPNDPITPFFALALFDGGAIAWLMAWIGHARGLMQRSISVIMLVIDLGGVVLLSAGRLLAGGQTMADIPASLAAAVIYGVIGATLFNLAAIYVFHVSDPDIMEDIETAILEDTLRAEAMKQAQQNIEAQAQKLGAILAARATGKLKYRLALPMADDEARAVIEAPEDKPATPGILETWMRSAATKVKDKMQPAPAMQIYQAATSAPGTIEDRTAQIEAQQPATLYDAMKQGIQDNKGDGVFTDGKAAE